MGRPISDERKKLILKMSSEGVSYNTISRALGISNVTVGLIVRRQKKFHVEQSKNGAGSC